MSRISRDEMCMEFAVTAAKRSTCLRRQVGAVIAQGGRPLTIGYAGAPSGMPHCTPETCNEQNPCKNTIHAEANAIAWAARMGVPTAQATLYCTLSPCDSCAKLILAAGISRVVFMELYREHSPCTLLLSAGVDVSNRKGNLTHIPYPKYPDNRAGLLVIP